MKTFKDILENKMTVKDWEDHVTKEKEEINPLHEKLSNHYNFPEGNNQYKNLREYTDNSFFINKDLWDAHNNNGFLNRQETNLDINPTHLNSALNKHKTPQSMTVYSGTVHDPKKTHQEGDIFHHPAYLSTSIRKSVGLGFAQSHMLQIHVPKGSRGAYVGHISHTPDEHEFIIPAASNLKYKGTHEEIHPNPYGSPRKINIHHMELVND